MGDEHHDDDREDRQREFASYFKERVYATFTGLAIVLVVATSDHPDTRHAFLALVLGVLGIVAAGFVSDVLSHLMAHRTFPSRREFLLLVRVALGGLSTVVLPVILIGLAHFDVLSIDVALRVATIVYIATLAVIGWLAVHRSSLGWFSKFVVLVILVALGLVVIGLQTLAKAV